MPSKIAFAAAALTAVSIIAATPASGAVLVLGQGLAKTCSDATIAGRDDLKAIETCSLAIQTQAMGHRDRAGTFVNRGILKLRRSSYDAARADFADALRLSPDLGEAYVNWGASLIAERRYAEGLSEIDRGMALGVEEPEKAWFNRAIAYEALGDARQAYLAYQQAVALAPEWAPPKLELARFTVTSK
ncbi:MAG: tetratricopeptide repeat protein [Caulobacteraceae bacterium]|nr:MAG: tetratricopeptide repeat protein [Caulobacteraceae bacterium]